MCLVRSNNLFQISNNVQRNCAQHVPMVFGIRVSTRRRQGWFASNVQAHQCLVETRSGCLLEHLNRPRGGQAESDRGKQVCGMAHTGMHSPVTCPGNPRTSAHVKQQHDFFARTRRPPPPDDSNLLRRWKTTMREHFVRMHAVGIRLAGLLSVGLGLEASTFADCFSEKAHALRLLHYSAEASSPLGDPTPPLRSWFLVVSGVFPLCVLSATRDFLPWIGWALEEAGETLECLLDVQRTAHRRTSLLKNAQRLLLSDAKDAYEMLCSPQYDDHVMKSEWRGSSPSELLVWLSREGFLPSLFWLLPFFRFCCFCFPHTLERRCRFPPRLCCRFRTRVRA